MSPFPHSYTGACSRNGYRANELASLPRQESQWRYRTAFQNVYLASVRASRSRLSPATKGKIVDAPLSYSDTATPQANYVLMVPPLFPRTSEHPLEPAKPSEPGRPSQGASPVSTFAEGDSSRDRRLFTRPAKSLLSSMMLPRT